MKINRLHFPAFLLLVWMTLGLALKGLPGNVTQNDLSDPRWINNGPFELSPERGRFALTYNLVENTSVYFSRELARFTTPDLGYINGRYVSLFAPAVSFLAIPGYIMGKAVGFSQVGAFSTSSFFAFLNFLLVAAVSRRLGAGRIASWLAGLTFLFATPAFAYATTLYQHHISTFLLLASFYLLIRWSNFWSLFVVWLLIAAAIPVDYPNLFIMLPIGLMATGRVIKATVNTRNLRISITPLRLLSLSAVIIPLAFFLWFNQVSYGHPLQLSGTVASVKYIGPDGLPAASNLENADYQPPQDQHKSAIGFFKTRNLIRGLYIHLFSPDRGIVLYTPVMLFAVLVFFLPRTNQFVQAAVTAISVNLVLYSLWGDPWGGWAFGSRYLIPAYALAAVLIGLVLKFFSRHRFLWLLFTAAFIYSVAVNTLGAVTTNLVPPGVEIPALSAVTGRQERFSYDRNLEYLLSRGIKSVAYHWLAAPYLSAWQYALLVGAVPAFLGGFLIWQYKYDRD